MSVARLMQMAAAGSAGAGPEPSGWTDPDLANASYDSVSFSVAGQETSPFGVRFSNDGLKMFVQGYGSDKVYQYELSSAYDLSTASYSSLSASVNGSLPYGFCFNSDGTKLYSVDLASDNVTEYSLSSAFDLTGGLSQNSQFSIASQDGQASDVVFNASGTKMFVLGNSNDSVFQYSLSSAFDISTVSYDGVSFSLNSQDSTPNGIEFNPDGTKLFMIGASSDSVYQYTLSSAFDVSTASYDSISFSVTSQDTSPSGITFKNDGSKMYISGDGTNTIYQYSTAAPAPAEWIDPDLANASYDSVSFSVAGQETTPLGINFNNDGTKAYIVGGTTDSVYEYPLSTAWDLSTASYNSVSFSVAPQNTVPTSVVFNSDGTKMYVTGIIGSIIYQYSLSTGFDISTASYDSISFDVSSQVVDLVDLSFSYDGTKLYALSFGSDTVYQYSLSTGFDISTASYDSVSFSVTAQERDPTALKFNPNGTKMYVCGIRNYTVYQYSLSSVFDVSTASYDSVSFSVAAQLSNPRGFTFKSDGSKMYVVGVSNDTIYQYSTD